jgi:hypothetical protein
MKRGAVPELSTFSTRVGLFASLLSLRIDRNGRGVGIPGLEKTATQEKLFWKL